jgi:hypothetical protein
MNEELIWNNNYPGGVIFFFHLTSINKKIIDPLEIY